MDLYFVNDAPSPIPCRLVDASISLTRYWNRLYRNKGDRTVSDVTETAKVDGDLYGMGVAAADYDNDGNVDLYITNLGKNILSSAPAEFRCERVYKHREKL